MHLLYVYYNVTTCIMCTSHGTYSSIWILVRMVLLRQFEVCLTHLRLLVPPYPSCQPQCLIRLIY